MGVMVDAGRILMLVGVAIVVVGAIIWGAGRAGFGGLPGDIRYHGGNVRVYFPIVTCIVVSVLLTALMWLWRWLSGR
jgi:hypothetical protein